MKTVHLPDFYQGMALQAQFPVVKTEEANYHTGEIVKVTIGTRDTELGEAEVIAIKKVMLSKLPDTLSGYIMGKPAPYFIATLKKMNGLADEHTMVQVVVLQYKQRYLAEQLELLKKWWQKQVDMTPGYEAFKMQGAAI